MSSPIEINNFSSASESPPELLRQLVDLQQQQHSQPQQQHHIPNFPFSLNMPPAPSSLSQPMAQLQLFNMLAKAQLLAKCTEQVAQQQYSCNQQNAIEMPQQPHQQLNGLDPKKILSAFSTINATTNCTVPTLHSTVSTNQHATVSPTDPLLPINKIDKCNQKTRRRATATTGNMDNTLDGLVAKRAEQMPSAGGVKRRYQTETEALELPDDEMEIKRMEADPDVCTRMCSVCGYQGKWVSEMIRHKRVHTNDRPFKCKYCNRTSKWKADLIRHVAKTHGIRVVSKYSRSKAFELGQKQRPNNNHVEDDEVIMLDSTDAVGGGDGSSTYSSASSESGQSVAQQQQPMLDENNNHNHNGNHGHGHHHHHRRQKNGESLNSYTRKVQRLSSIVRNNQQQLVQQQQQQQQVAATNQQGLLCQLKTETTSSSAPMSSTVLCNQSAAAMDSTVIQQHLKPSLASDTASASSLTLLQFLNVFPQLFPQNGQQQFCGQMV